MMAWFKEGNIASGVTTWASSVGGFIATITGTNTVLISAANANGLPRPVKYISGSPATQVLFGNILTGSVWTICTLTRYTGANKGRIMNDIGGNFIHGHYAGNAGVAHYGFWRTTSSTSGSTDWFAFCGQNGGANLIMSNGVTIGTGSGGSSKYHTFWFIL